MTVRQTEALVRKLQAPAKPATTSTAQDPNIRHLQDDLATRLGAKVQIQHSANGKGKLVLSYSSLDELDGILAHIK
jgi:ParB family chromosome partitioning protein